MDKKYKKVCDALLPKYIPMTTTNTLTGSCDADIVFFRHKLMEAMIVPPERIKELIELNDKSFS